MTFHAQGIYPSLRKVKSILPAGWMRRPEARRCSRQPPWKAKRRRTTMFTQEPKGRPEATSQQCTATSKGESTHVAEAQVQAQRAKREMQKQEHLQQHVSSTTNQQAKE